MTKCFWYFVFFRFKKKRKLIEIKLDGNPNSSVFTY